MSPPAITALALLSLKRQYHHVVADFGEMEEQMTLYSRKTPDNDAFSTRRHRIVIRVALPYSYCANMVSIGQSNIF